MQQKNVNMSWDYSDFPHHPIEPDQNKFRVRDTFISHNIYRVYPKLGNGFYLILMIPFTCPACIYKIEKTSYQIVLYHPNQDMNLLKQLL